MTELLAGVEAPSDAELISRVRAGDLAAYGELFSRHVEAARRLGRQLARGGDVDDLVSDAFAKTLTVLQKGGGPDVAFRAYLLTSLRRLHVDRIRAAKKVQPAEDLTVFDPGVPFQDTAVANFESGAAARAFASLPERWQLVLWHLEVEGQKPADIAPLLGMSPNSVSALAYRAREGLRQAFLTMHLADTPTEQCRWVNEHLGAYVRKGLSKRDTTKVEDHLEGCRRCTAMYLELDDVNSNLAGIIAPLLLGAAATGYASSAGGAGAAGVSAFVGRVRDAVTGNGAAGGAGGSAGVGGTAAAAGGAAVTTGGLVTVGGVVAASVAAVTAAAFVFGGGPQKEAITDADRPIGVVQTPAAPGPGEAQDPGVPRGGAGSEKATSTSEAAETAAEPTAGDAQVLAAAQAPLADPAGDPAAESATNTASDTGPATAGTSDRPSDTTVTPDGDSAVLVPPADGPVASDPGPGADGPTDGTPAADDPAAEDPIAGDPGPGAPPAQQPVLDDQAPTTAPPTSGQTPQQPADETGGDSTPGTGGGSGGTDTGTGEEPTSTAPVQVTATLGAYSLSGSTLGFSLMFSEASPALTEVVVTLTGDADVRFASENGGCRVSPTDDSVATCDVAVTPSFVAAGAAGMRALSDGATTGEVSAPLDLSRTLPGQTWGFEVSAPAGYEFSDGSQLGGTALFTVPVADDGGTGDGTGDGGTSEPGDGTGDGGTSEPGDGTGDGGTSEPGDGTGDGGTGDGTGDTGDTGGGDDVEPFGIDGAVQVGEPGSGQFSWVVVPLTGVAAGDVVDLSLESDPDSAAFSDTCDNQGERTTSIQRAVELDESGRTTVAFCAKIPGANAVSLTLTFGDSSATLTLGGSSTGPAEVTSD